MYFYTLNIISKIRDLLIISKNIKKVYEDYGDELKMAGTSVVMGENVSTLNKDPDCLTKIVIGSNKNVQVIINDILKETK